VLEQRQRREVDVALLDLVEDRPALDDARRDLLARAALVRRMDAGGSTPNSRPIRTRDANMLVATGVETPATRSNSTSGSRPFAASCATTAVIS
jgi:hypothetical protein